MTTTTRPRELARTAWIPAVLGVVAVLLVAFGPEGFLRAVIVAAALLVVPGHALLPRGGWADRWTRSAMVVGASVTVETLVALATLWTGLWHLVTGCALLLLASAWILLRDLRDPIGRGGPAAATSWAAVLDDGRRLELTGVVLIGRSPAANPGEQATLVTIPDDTKTVSKTHLALGVNDAGPYAEDRGSSNGLTVTAPTGDHVSCAPGQQVTVQAEDIVSFGAHWLTISREDS